MRGKVISQISKRRHTMNGKARCKRRDQMIGHMKARVICTCIVKEKIMTGDMRATMTAELRKGSRRKTSRGRGTLTVQNVTRHRDVHGAKRHAV